MADLTPPPQPSGEPGTGETGRTVTALPCPTCSGPTRETVGMVCQTCGTDYGSTAFFVVLDVLRPLCDDLPGEPPALIAWGPEQLARRIVEGLRADGWEVRRA